MTLALDVNRYSDLMAQVPEVVRRVETSGRVYLPLFVLGEIRFGFARGTRPQDNEEKLQRFLHSGPAEVLLPDLSTTEIYARLKTYLRKVGTPIPENDLWLAAICVQHNIPLYTRDTHFDRLPQVMRV